MKKDLTTGRPIAVIVRFVLPLLLGNLFQQFYNMVDSAIVGKYLGADALASVGCTGSINFLIIGFMVGISSGFSIIVARYFGAKDMDGVRRAIGTILWLSIGISAVVTTAAALLTGQILQWMQTPDNIFKGAYDYIFIIFLGIPATMLYNTLAGILRAFGDSKTPLYFLIFASLVNVGLDFLFVLGCDMGVGGAGLATVLSQLLSGILCFVYMHKKLPDIHLSRSDLKFRPILARQLIVVGLPMALQFSITAIGTIIAGAVINTLGSAAVAAVSAAGKSQAFLTTPTDSMGATMATYCGQNLGAGKIDRVKKGYWSSIGIGLAFCAFASPFSMFLGRYVSLLFLDASETVILDMVAEYLFFNGLFYPALLMVNIVRNCIQGLGHSALSMIAGIMELIGRAGATLILVKVIGFTGVALSAPLAWMLAIAFLIPAYHIIVNRLAKIIKHRESSPLFAEM